MHVSLCGKRTCARYRRRTHTAMPQRRRQWTLSNEVGRWRRLLVCRMANDAGAVGPQTLLNYAASLLKFESWLEQREEKVVTDAEIDAAMCTWIGKPSS